MERDGSRCVFTGMPHPHACHIWPFAANNTSEKHRNTRDILTDNVLMLSGSVRRKLADILAPRTGELATSDKAFNMLCMRPDIHVYWGKAYFGLEWLGTKGKPDELGYQSYVVRWNWTPSQLLDKLDPSGAGIVADASKRLPFAKRHVDLDTDEGSEALTKALIRAFEEPNLVDRPAPVEDIRGGEHLTLRAAIHSPTIHPIQTGQEFELKVLAEDLETTEFLIKTQWTAMRIAALTGAAEAVDHLLQKRPPPLMRGSTLTNRGLHTTLEFSFGEQGPVYGAQYPPPRTAPADPPQDPLEEDYCLQKLFEEESDCSRGSTKGQPPRPNPKGKERMDFGLVSMRPKIDRTRFYERETGESSKNPFGGQADPSQDFSGRRSDRLSESSEKQTRGASPTGTVRRSTGASPQWPPLSSSGESELHKSSQSSSDDPPPAPSGGQGISAQAPPQDQANPPRATPFGEGQEPQDPESGAADTMKKKFLRAASAASEGLSRHIRGSTGETSGSEPPQPMRKGWRDSFRSFRRTIVGPGKTGSPPQTQRTPLSLPLRQKKPRTSIGTFLQGMRAEEAQEQAREQAQEQAQEQARK